MGQACANLRDALLAPTKVCKMPIRPHVRTRETHCSRLPKFARCQFARMCELERRTARAYQSLEDANSQACANSRDALLAPTKAWKMPIRKHVRTRETHCPRLPLFSRCRPFIF